MIIVAMQYNIRIICKTLKNRWSRYMHRKLIAIKTGSQGRSLLLPKEVCMVDLNIRSLFLSLMGHNMLSRVLDNIHFNLKTVLMTMVNSAITCHGFLLGF